MPKPHAWLDHLLESAPLHALTGHLLRDRRVVVEGARGSAGTLLAGGLAVRTGRTVLLVVAHLDEADDAMDDLEWLTRCHDTLKVQRFGALEVLPGESNVSLDLLAERLATVRQLHAAATSADTNKASAEQRVIVAPIQALMQAVPQPQALSDYMFNLNQGQLLSPGSLIDWLTSAGYQRQDAIEQPGDFAVRGGIIDLYPPALGNDAGGHVADTAQPIRIDFFGDEIDTIHLIDIDTMGSTQSLTSVCIIGAGVDQLQRDQGTMNLIDLLPADALVVLHEAMELGEQARGYYERLTDARGIFAPTTIFKKLTALPHAEMNLYSSRPDEPHRIDVQAEPLPTFDQDAGKAIEQLGELAVQRQQRVVVLCGKPAERERLLELLQQYVPDAAAAIATDIGYMHRGFIWRHIAADVPPDASPSLMLLPHHELFHRYEVRRRVRQISADLHAHAGDAFLDLNVGDYVVHVDHGIARFNGIKTMRRQNRAQEYLTLAFADNALLHVPATQIDLVQKYIGGFHGKPPLSQLGGKRWSRTKESVAEAVKELAKKLLQLQAARQTMPGIRFPQDTNWQNEFEAEFPYDETEDQLAAVAAIKLDMTSDRPMDRLICGDVGFGKTEVAIRAAFKAAEFGKQVAVLVPTTVLAEQHERTFRSRMADYPFRIESLSRFKTDAAQRRVLDALQAGQVDMVIGTHRLLSKDVRFADLGLVIIDEEQRFGVEHKNRLLELRLTADVLTLTATPIPRTLHMSMVGLRDISSLSTAPVDRRAVVTEVIPFDRKRVKQAIVREMNRDGQVYFVHNRVHSIRSIAAELQSLVPDARIIVGHGQMPPRELEKVMLSFINREADILVSTTIIESGIDIPTANTMFINQADHFGLAELHQLRGRVGRYKHRAYCYLLLPENRPINDVAARRLKAIEQYAMLGAGFKIAMRDLEIRGAGNLLGAEQSGHIAAVGYEMYCLMLEQQTKRLRHEPIIEPTRTHLELPAHGSLPKRYIPSDKHRLDVYRRIARAVKLEELDAVVQSMKDAYGEPPAPARELLDLAELRIAASTLGIDEIKLEKPDLIFTVNAAAQLHEVFADAPGRVTILDPKTLYYRPPDNYLEPLDTLLAVLRKLLVRRERH